MSFPLSGGFNTTWAPFPKGTALHPSSGKSFGALGSIVLGSRHPHNWAAGIDSLSARWTLASCALALDLKPRWCRVRALKHKIAGRSKTTLADSCVKML